MRFVWYGGSRVGVCLYDCGMIIKPKFATEEEEADWYPAHPEYVEEQFRLAKAEGRLGHGTVAKKLAEIAEKRRLLEAERDKV